MRAEDLRRAGYLAPLLAAAALLAAAFSTTPASAADAGSTRLPCAEYDTSIGEYGAFVFELRHKPRSCVEYKGNKPCHCTEARLSKIAWRHWGSARTRATATWTYCGMGSCFVRRAYLVASRIRETCGLPVYTSLRMRLPATRHRGERFPATKVRYRLPACATVFDET